MTEAEADVYKRIDKFHAHLDICSQCRNHCWNLCPTGAQLLREAATGEQAPKTEHEEGGTHEQTSG